MLKKLSVFGLFVSVFALVVVSPASAHVVVRPAEVLTAGFQTFTVGAPNEKDAAYTAIKLQLPEGLKHVSVTNKPDWDTNIVKEGEGESAVVKSITWTGYTPPGYREDFTFSAQVPEEEAELQWKAYQTYDDGVTVAWDLTEDQQPKKKDGSPDFSKSGPLSVSKVVTQTEVVSAQEKSYQAAEDARQAADRALYVGVAALIVGFVAIYLITRKK